MANDTPPTWEETNAPPTWESTTEFGAGDVLRSVAPGSLSPDTLLPAVRLMGGEVVTGEQGDTHPDIIEREGIATKDLDQRGFTGPGGVFIDREAAAQGTQLPTEFEPGRLHSTDLLNFQERPDTQEQTIQFPYLKSQTAKFPNLKISPLEQAEIAAGHKVETGMGPGTELLTAVASDIPRLSKGAVELFTPALQTGTDWARLKQSGFAGPVVEPVEKGFNYAGNLIRAIPADIAESISGNEKYYDMLNLGAAALGENMPIDEALNEAASESKTWATVGKLSQGLAASAPMVAAFGYLPPAAQQIALASFTANMIKEVPEIAAQLGDELGKPVDQQDPAKISSLVSQGIQDVGFGTIGAFAMARGPLAIKPTVKEFPGRVGAPAIPEAELRTQGVPIQPDVVRAGPFQWSAEPLPLPNVARLGAAGAITASSRRQSPTSLEAIRAEEPPVEAKPAAITDQQSLPSATDLFRASADEVREMTKGTQGEALTEKLAREMTEEQLKESEPIIADYIQRQIDARKKLDQGKIGVQEFINITMERGTKGKILSDVFARLKRPIPEQTELATALEAREGFEGKPMEADAIWKRLEEQHGIKKGGFVELINDPNKAAGEIFADKLGNPIRIELNQAKIATHGQIDWLLQHEAAHWFDLKNPTITENILKTLSDTEWEGVFNKVVDLKYGEEKIPYEISARSIQKLADAWRDRGWFDKLVGNVQRFAHETLGIKMTRRAAESTSVRAIAQSIKRIGETAATKPDVSAAMAAWRQRTAAPKPVEPALLSHTDIAERWILDQVPKAKKAPLGGSSQDAALKVVSEWIQKGETPEGPIPKDTMDALMRSLGPTRDLETGEMLLPGDEFWPRTGTLLNFLESQSLDRNPEMSFEARMPGIESAEDIKKGVQSLMLPSAKSPEHLRAAELLASKLGPMHHRGEVAANKLRQWSKAFDKLGVHREDVPLPENSGIQFMSAMSQGKPLSGPKAKAASELIQKLFSERLEALEKADAPLETVRENYFPGMWTKESRLAFNAAMEKLGEGIDVNNATAAQKEAIKSLVDQYLDQGVGSEKDALGYLTRWPMKGKESFRKQKVFDDIMDGVEFGLRPISNNPIDLVQLKLAEMDRSIMANEYFKSLKDRGELKVIPPGREIPEGWQKVNDKYGTIYGPPVEGVFGRRIMGYRIVPEAHGDIINNYLSSSLYNNRYFGPLYKGWMSLANALNQTQLGMGSAFHGGFTTGEAQISAGANVLKDIYGVLRGNRSVKDLGNSIAKASMATVQNPIIGDRVLNAWRDKDAQINPRIAQVVKAAELAGAGFKMETGLRTEQSTKLLRDWYSGNRLKAAARSPVALTELLAKPIMEYLVPRQKAGVFADLAWRIIEQNPGKSLEELTPQFRQAWNRVDARLGQVRYDRLFINNTAKNVVQGLVRAPGWSGGTIAEIGGGFTDAGKFLSEWVKTGKLPQNIPDRTAYVLSLLTTVMATNAALTYAFTGTKPKGLDYFAFRTGNKDEQGRDERFLIPSYMKDILAYAKHPGQTLINKAHPLIGMISDLIKNKDYYGVEIRSRDAGAIKKAGETAAYVVKGFEPFWTRGTRREVERGAAPVSARTVAPLVGIMPAPRSVTQTKAEGLAHDLMLERIPAGARTKESAERARLRAEKTKGQDYLTRTVKRLDVESAMRVWNAATPEEKQKIKSEVLSKIGRSRTLTREREEALKNLVNSATP